jgi:hypothetical protein
MKKLLTTLLATIFALTMVTPAGATLSSYYTSIGQTLPTVSQRAPLASSFGIVGYSGTFAQNNALEANLRASGSLGGGNGATTSSVPTNKTPFLNSSQTWTGSNTFNGTSTFNGTTTIQGELYNTMYPGTIVFASEDSEVNTPSLTYVKLRDIKITGKSGTTTVSFGIMGNGYSFNILGRIYKNGVAVGTERTTSTLNVVQTYTEDIPFVSGDSIQIYGKISTQPGGATIRLQNFRLQYGFNVQYIQ